MSPEFERRRQGRNRAIGIVLGVLALLFFGITIGRMKP